MLSNVIQQSQWCSNTNQKQTSTNFPRAAFQPGMWPSEDFWSSVNNFTWWWWRHYSFGAVDRVPSHNVMHSEKSIFSGILFHSSSSLLSALHWIFGCSTSNGHWKRTWRIAVLEVRYPVREQQGKHRSTEEKSLRCSLSWNRFATRQHFLFAYPAGETNIRSSSANSKLKGLINTSVSAHKSDGWCRATNVSERRRHYL